MNRDPMNLDPAAIAVGPWLVPPLLRYVAGREDRVYVLLSAVDAGSGHSACAIARSDDAGRTWSEPAVIATSVGPTGAHPDGDSRTRWLAHALAVDVANVDKIYVTLESWTGKERHLHLAVSTDGGATFDLAELSFPGHQGSDSYLGSLQKSADVASIAADVVGIATIMPKAGFDGTTSPDLLYWRVDVRALQPSEATAQRALEPTTVLPLHKSGPVHGARIDVGEGGRVRVFYASGQGIQFRECVDGATFGEERGAEVAARALSEFVISRVGEKTALVSGGGTNIFAYSTPVLHVAVDPGSTFEARELRLGDGAGGHLRIQGGGPTNPCWLSCATEGGTRVFVGHDAGERFSSVLLEGRAYGAYQAHDTGHGLVVVARAPLHGEEERDEPAEPCVAFRIGFAAGAPGGATSVEAIPIRARGQRSPSFDEWLGLSPALALRRGEELDAGSMAVSRLGGPAIGVHEWPTRENGQPLQHILTLDLRGRRDAKGPAAIALFAALYDDFGQAIFRVVELSEADLAAPRLMTFPGDEADGRLEVPSELVLEEPSGWSDSYCGGQPCYVQGDTLFPSGSGEDLAGHLHLTSSAGEFICQFGESLFPDFDFGDGGIVYIHRREAWLEMC